MRRTSRYFVKGPNALWQLYKTVSFFKVMKNFVVIQICRYCPFLPVKNGLYRKLLKMEIGSKTAFALMVMPDVMFPEKIKVGTNTVIGYNTTILTHEYLIKEYRIGEVRIGDNVIIGANTTILPGIEIGNDAIISAASLVHKDVPPGAFVGGNPMQIIYTSEERARLESSQLEKK